MGRSRRGSPFPLRTMKLVTLLPFLMTANARELPQRRVRKASRPVLYHHILHEKPKPELSRFWIPSNTDSKRRLFGGQESFQKEQVKKASSLEVHWDQTLSLWYVHGDASLHSPDEIYRKRRKERQQDKKESSSPRLSWNRRAQAPLASELLDEQVDQQEDTTYALGDKNASYTAGDTDMVYDDSSGAGHEPEPFNGTLNTWNVSTSVEYGNDAGEGTDNDHKTNATSSVVYTTTVESNDTSILFQPIRIRAILSEQGDGGEFLTEKERMMLFQDILSPAIVAWSAALRVDPVVGNLTVDKFQLYDNATCGPGLDSGYPSVPVPPSHFSDGIPDTDIVVYLSLGFVTEPSTLNPFSESLTGSNSQNSTNASTASVSNASPNSSVESGEWSFNSSAMYGFDADDTKDVEWPSCSGEYLAAASYCSTDQYDRPTAALLHLCIDDSFFLERSVERDITTVMHELGHVLGFNTQSMAHFRRPDGTPITPRDNDGDIVDSEVECTGPSHHRRSEMLPLPSEEILHFRSIRGVRVAEVVTPSVRQVVRNHFDCQSLNGAELESGNVYVTNVSNVSRDDVSYEEAVASCIGDHWEKRLFRIDLMNPVVDDVPFSLRFSPITLALFADSGWYQVDLSRTTFSASWGRAAGCGFVNDNCVSEYGEIAEANKPFFCNEVVSSSAKETLTDEIQGCSPDLTRKATCSISRYSWALPLEYQYFNSTFGSNVGGSEPLLDYCPVYNGFANGLCKDSENQRLLQVNRIEAFGAKNSRCLGGIMGQQKTALCLSIACVVEDRTLRVKVNGRWHLCSYSGQLISVSGDEQSHVICPDPIRTCPTFYCNRDCLGTGGTCNYTSGSCFCRIDDENGTSTEKCFGLEDEHPDYDVGFYNDDDDNSAKTVDDSSLSDYYVPTERELQDENDSLEVWMIALIVLFGGIVGAIVFALCVRAAVRRCCSLGGFNSFWFWWPPDASEPVVVESSSPRANKDKFVASLLVDMRVHGGHVGRSSEDSFFESTTETEGSLTETDNSFTKHSDELSLEPFDDISQDSKSDTSDNTNVDTQLNVRSDMPVSIMRKRIIPESV